MFCRIPPQLPLTYLTQVSAEHILRHNMFLKRLFFVAQNSQKDNSGQIKKFWCGSENPHGQTNCPSYGYTPPQRRCSLIRQFTNPLIHYSLTYCLSQFFAVTIKPFRFAKDHLQKVQAGQVAEKAGRSDDSTFAWCNDLRLLLFSDTMT